MDNQPDIDYLQRMDSAILQLLRSQPDGVSEFELIKRLQHPPYSFFDKNSLLEPLILFQTHFIVFNALYRLKEQGLKTQVYDIDILPTNVKIRHIQATTSTSHTTYIKSRDPLSEYYLDWSNFSTTKERDVTQLINSFWRKMAGVEVSEEEQKALHLFGFEHMPCLATLKNKYKALSHQYHPDKGGNKTRFTKLTAAYQLLKRRL